MIVTLFHGVAIPSSTSVPTLEIVQHKILLTAGWHHWRSRSYRTLFNDAMHLDLGCLHDIQSGISHLMYANKEQRA